MTDEQTTTTVMDAVTAENLKHTMAAVDRDVQRPPESTAQPADLDIPAEPLRLFKRQQTAPEGLLARGRSGRFTPVRWEAFVDDHGIAYLTLHSQKPSQIPPVILQGPRAELLTLLEAVYWGVQDAQGDAQAEAETQVYE